MIDNRRQQWKRDWHIFVQCVGAAFDEGLDSIAVTKRFCGETVTWSGKLVETRLDDEESPGVQFEMPSVTIRLSDGRTSIVDYLFLQLKKEEVGLWRNIRIGRTVGFHTRIKSAIGPFPGITWLALDERRGVITFSTDGARPL